MSANPRHKSSALLDGPDRAVARGMMKAAGFTDDDLKLIFGAGYTEAMPKPDHYWIPLIALYYVAAGVAALRDKATARKRAAAEAAIDAELASGSSSLVE